MCGDGRGWEMGECLVGECPCFVEVELGSRVTGAGEAGSGPGREHTGKLVGLAAFEQSFTCNPVHQKAQPSSKPRSFNLPWHGCIETRGVSKEVKEDSSKLTKDSPVPRQGGPSVFPLCVCCMFSQQEFDF